MKQQKLIIISLLSFLFIGLTSFKYEEGPFISFLSKKTRLCREWTLEKYINANGEIDNDVEKSTFTFNKNLTGKANFNYGDQTTTNNFKWMFSEDKAYIHFISEDDYYREKIIRLTRKELWLEDNDGDVTYFKTIKK